MAHYAIGDVQGCYTELMALLDKIAFNEKTDTLWFAGDLINGGPDNLSVLRFISQLPQKPIVVLGNHDLHFLGIFYKIRTLQSEDTLQDILTAPDLEELSHWLQAQSLAHYDPKLNCLMTHAGLSPLWSLQDTLNYAKEIETQLNPQESNKIQPFLKAIFSREPGEKQLHWRLITDTLTRMRFCDRQGKLNLHYKGTLHEAPPDIYPWFDARFRPPLSINILFGHWAALEKQSTTPYLYPLDTGCVWGGKLSALRLEDKKWFQVRGKKYR